MILLSGLVNKTGTRKLNWKPEIQMLDRFQKMLDRFQKMLDRFQKPKLEGAIKINQKIFIKKNYYFICIPLIYNNINNLDIK